VHLIENPPCTSNEHCGSIVVQNEPRVEYLRSRRLWRPRLRQRVWFLTFFLAAITLGGGVLNLVSVMGGPSHRKVLAEIFPLGFVHLSRTLTTLIGFALILSSINIYRRKKRAWGIVLVLSLFSAFFHLTRGLDYKAALFSCALVLLLLLTRNTFSVRSSAPDLRSGLLRLLFSAVVAIGYGIAGFWFLDQRQFGINFHLGDAIGATLSMLSLAGDPNLLPQTRYGHWFLDSLYTMTFTAALYSGFALFRPVLYQFRIVPRERALAREIVKQHARVPLDLFKLWPDKSYFFSSSHRCVIAYRVADNVAIALGDPVGPEEEIGGAVREFLHTCRENGWSVAFYQTLPDLVPVYRRAGLSKLKIGDDAIVNLTEFSIAGKGKRELRCKVRQLEAIGVHAVEYQPPIPEDVLEQFKAVSDQWLQIPGRRERSFTLGQFVPEYVRSTTALAAVDGSGTVLAFINLIAVDKTEMSGDLMRRRLDAPNGIMDYLFVKVFQYGKENGFARFNLGMAPMAGFQESEQAGPEERAIHSFFQQLNFLFSFRGLRFYKAKFATTWEPRYLIYRKVLDLPRVALALRRVSEAREETMEGEYLGGMQKLETAEGKA
jgi:phosphatidylglycerol lysyltransferase